MSFAKFKGIVEKAGLEAIDHGNNHWQIKGGALLVNYYPTTRTAFANGTVRGVKDCSIGKAVDLANSGPKQSAEKAKRKQSYWKDKARLMRINPRCRWCGILLTEKTATIDHIIPLGKGGSNYRDNLTLACHPCNKSKADSLTMLQDQARKIRQAF
jgi:hypothetical protein